METGNSGQFNPAINLRFGPQPNASPGGILATPGGSPTIGVAKPESMTSTLLEALSLLGSFDHRLLDIVLLSLQVSLSALAIGTLVGLPIGAWLAVAEFRGRGALIVVLNALMGLPSVVVGVIVYLALSRSGPFGSYGLLFSPAAMITAQSVLVVPLIAAVTRQIVEDAWREYAPEFSLIGLTRSQSVLLLLADCRFSLTVATLAGLGRAMSEVGAVMIVGGNIDGYTRVMTTAIALETSKGDLALSIALGIVLMSVIVALNVAAHHVRCWAARRYG
jgi:tungstate transport system permease protein